MTVISLHIALPNTITKYQKNSTNEAIPKQRTSSIEP